MERKSKDSCLKEHLNMLEKTVQESVTSIQEQHRAFSDHRIPAWNNENYWNFYYANACTVCHTTSRVESCNRCKMIFYCGEKHRKKHWPEHKDLCKVILGMLKEIGATTLFDNLKTNNAETWMKTKIYLMLKAESKLGNPLLPYQKEMFLFPKTCFVCHESDLSVLKPCDCGVSLCKQHKKDERHQKLCRQFHEGFKLALEMKDIKPYPLIQMEAEDIVQLTESLETIPVSTEITNLPNSMKEFLQTYMKLKGQTAVKVKVLTHYRTQILSEFISRPLTLIYAIQKLNLMSSSNLTVHVIGATYNEFVFGECWEILLHWIPALKNLEMIFVGPELKETYSIHISVCSSCKHRKKYIESIGIALSYEDYFHKNFPMQRGFQKPDIVIGFNLDLHESELGIINCTWKDAFSTLKKVNAPFILTAGTEERAKKDHQMLCKLLGKSVSHLFCEPNPFAGLIPERDFETEELRYTNKHILIYKGFYEETTESTELKDDPVEKKRVFLTIGELKKQFELEEKIKSEKVFQFKGKQNEIAASELKKDSKSVTKKPNLLKENLLLNEEHRLLKENDLLKKENNQLMSENKELKQENDRLKAENQLIKDLRSQVKESIKAAMSEQK